MAAELCVEVGLGRGSEFVAWLPLLSSDEVNTLQPARPATTAHAPVEARHSRRVLIVDDQEAVRTSLGRLVRSFGHKVAIASDGPSAIALAKSFQPECAILDISLQGMTGIELGRRLREKFPREKLFMIALTGFAAPGMHEKCLAAGFDEHFVKPGEISKLAQLLGGDRPGEVTTGK